MTRAPASETAHGRTQRERVLRAAMDIFSTQGFRGASLDAIADAVGMTRQGLLHYFPSKVHLLLGVLDLRQEDNAELVQQMIERSHGLADTCADRNAPQRDRMVIDLRKKERVIVLPCGERSVRFRPALSVTEDEIDEAVAAVRRAARRLDAEVQA